MDTVDSHRSYRATLLAFSCAVAISVFPLFSRLVVFASDHDCHTAIKTLTDLGNAISAGASMNLSDPQQRDLFNLYLSVFFGSPTQYVNSRTVDAVGQFMARYPDLNKDRLTSVEVKMRERSHPVLPETDALINALRKNSAQNLQKLLRPLENISTWKKFLRPEERERLGQFAKSTQILKQMLEARLASLDSTSWTTLQSTAASFDERVKAAFLILSSLRSQNEKSKSVSQAMADLVFLASFQSKDHIRALKSGDGLQRLEAIGAILAEVDGLAYSLGLPGHFEGLLSHVSIDRPSSLPYSWSGLLQMVAELVKQTEQNAKWKHAQGQETVFLVRSLSLIEAPFRSCLGLDCSSETWGTQGLDPNYHFFTLTKVDGTS